MTEVLLNSIEDKIEAQREIEAQEEYKEKYHDLEELIEGYMEQRRDEPASVASFPTEHHSLLENDERPDPGPTPVDNSVNHCFLAEHPPIQERSEPP